MRTQRLNKNFRIIFMAISLLSILMIPSNSFGSKLSCVDLTWNFGTIDDLTQVSNTYVLANTTASPIIIDSVKTSCSCTSHTLSTPVILPGKLIILPVVFNPKGRKGRIDKKIEIHTRGDSTPTILAIKGKIVPVVFISPKAIFVTGKPNTQFERKVSITFSDPTSILAIETEMVGISIDVEELIPRKSCILHVHGEIHSPRPRRYTQQRPKSRRVCSTASSSMPRVV